MGSTIQAIGTGTGNFFSGFKDATGAVLEGNFDQAGKDYVRGVGDWLSGGQADESLRNQLNGGPKATAGTISPTLTNVRDAQVQQATDFRQNSPMYAQQMTQNLRSDVNNQLGQNMKQTNERDAARGLLHGGMHEGAQMENRSKAAASAATGISNINSGLISAQQQLDANAVGTGTGVQQSAQQIQNQIYQQTMAQVNSQNSLIGQAASLGILAAVL